MWRGWRTGLVAATLVLLVMASTNAWVQLRDVRAALTQQRADASTDVAALRKENAELRKSLDALDAELDQVKGQRTELEQLAADIVRSRDEALLIEVERLINSAANELQLARNVGGALAALQAAEVRLARAERAPLVALRRSLARDIERLRALPKVDVTGIALRLDEIAAGIDGWPMLADPATPLARKAEPAAGATKPAPATTDDSLGARLRRWLSDEFGDLVRIREVQVPESVLLSTTQQQLVRQQLRLRLFDARQALIARSDKLYRADLQEARVLLLRYFDLKQSAPAAALAQIDKLAGAALTVEIPDPALGDTFAVLATARAARPAATRTP